MLEYESCRYFRHITIFTINLFFSLCNRLDTEIALVIDIDIDNDIKTMESVDNFDRLKLSLFDHSL